jgi:zinc protease
MSMIYLSSTSANLRPSLALMADVALNPSFPDDKFKNLKERRLAQIAQEKANPGAVANRILPALLFGANHAYGKPGSGYESSVGSISREDLVKWHGDWFKPGNATVVVTGDTTLSQVVPLLEAAFGSWEPGSTPQKNMVTVPKTSGKKVYLIDKPDAPQSIIVAAHVSELAGQPEDLASEPVMTNFGGMATSRLNRNLRLEKHWSYGSSGGLTNPRGQRMFVVNAPVQTDKTKESMAEVIKEIRNISGDRPITGEEFKSIMRSMTSRLPGRFETLASLEGAAIRQINQNLPADFWPRYAANIRSLDEAQLAAAAKKFVRPDEIIWIVVGDLRKIEAGVRELGYGEVTVLDNDGKRIR